MSVEMITDEVKASIAEGLGLLPSGMDTMEARVMLLAIGLQESKFVHRFQVVNGKPGEKGPARGLFQFEMRGGVVGVLTHPATTKQAERICELRSVGFEAYPVWRRLENDDILATCLARLLLFSDPAPLPKVTDPIAAWEYYLRTWRPGKPHRKTWAGYHAAAVLSADRRRNFRPTT